MRRLTENLSPNDRRYYWRFVGSLFGFYGALLAVTIGVLVGNHLAKNQALESAEAIGAKPPALMDAPKPLMHAVKYN
jgi:hypothetical protein